MFSILRSREPRDSVSFVTASLDRAEEMDPGVLKRALEARQSLLWGLADVDEVRAVVGSHAAGRCEGWPLR